MLLKKAVTLELIESSDLHRTLLGQCGTGLLTKSKNHQREDRTKTRVLTEKRSDCCEAIDGPRGLFIGLTDTEINYVFQLVPEQGRLFELQSISSLCLERAPVMSSEPSLRRYFSDLAVAGLLVIALRVIKEWFRSVNGYPISFSLFDFVFDRKNQPRPIEQLNETIQALQQSVLAIHRNIPRLQQAADRLASRADLSTAADTIQQELRLLKDSVLVQSASSSFPRHAQLTRVCLHMSSRKFSFRLPIRPLSLLSRPQMT